MLLYLVEREGKLMMLAPISTIRSLLDLHKLAVERIVRENGTLENPTILHNRRHGTLKIMACCEARQAIGENRYVE